MPSQKWKVVSIREDVFRRLKEFMDSEGLVSVTDAITVLLKYKDIYSNLGHILQKGVSLPQTEANLLQSGANPSSTQTGNVSMVSQSTQPAPPHLAVPPTMARVDDVNVRKTKKEKVVKWVRGIRDPDKYFDAVSKKEGRPVLWNEVGEGRICYAFEDEVAGLVDELNSVGAILDDVTKTDKYLDAKELYQCNLIYFDIVERKWKVLT